MNQLKLLIAIAVALAVTGCSTLTESQLKAVTKYSESVEKYSEFPGVVVKNYINLQHKIFVKGNSLKSDPKTASEYLAKNTEKKNDALAKAKELDDCFKIIQVYAKNLGTLAKTDYSEKISESAEVLGAGLDTLVVRYNKGKGDSKKLPEGLGALVHKSVVFIGKRKMNKERSNYIRTFINDGEDLIKKMCMVAKDFLENKVQGGWISSLNSEVQNLHKNMRIQLVNENRELLYNDTIKLTGSEAILDIDTVYYANTMAYVEVDASIADLYDEIYALEKLNNKLIKTLDDMVSAHTKLKLKIEEGKPITSVIGELATFMSSVAELMELHDSLKEEEEETKE